MNKENYDGLRKQLDNGSLDIPSQITILEIAYNLEQQLQAYKDREDKLRELVKDKLDEQTKTYQKILNEQQSEIDNLQRNADFYNEQMNDAVERTVELNKEKKDLKEWLEEEIKKSTKLVYGYLDDNTETRCITLEEVLERLGEYEIRSRNVC